MGFLRMDRGTLRPAQRIPTGVRADAHITRAGIFEYLDGNGRVRRELREPAEVFKPESLASFAQVPVTNDHPSVGLLDSKNAKDFSVGATGEQVTRDDDHVRTSVMVYDSNTIDQMEAGKLEVSCGYTCDVDDVPGVHPVYGRYDAVQRNIRGNHVAIVDSARAGRTARVRLDGAATQITTPPAQRGSNMDPEKMQETIRALGAQLTESKERTEEAEQKATAATTRADVAEGRLLTVEARVTELQSRLDSTIAATETAAVAREKERADKAEAKVARFDATIEKRIRTRSKLERQAAVVLGDDFRMDDLTDRDIRVAVVKRLDSTVEVGKEISDGIVEGRFLALVDGFNKNAQSQARVAEVLGSTNEQAPRVDAKEQQKQKLRDQWKAPLPNDIRSQR